MVIAYPWFLELAKKNLYIKKILKDFLPVIIGNMFFGVIIMMCGAIINNKINVQINVPHLNFKDKNVSAQFSENKIRYRNVSFTLTFDENLTVFSENNKTISNEDQLSLKCREKKSVKLIFIINNNVTGVKVIQTYKVTSNRKQEAIIKLVETVYA